MPQSGFSGASGSLAFPVIVEGVVQKASSQTLVVEFTIKHLPINITPLNRQVTDLLQIVSLKASLSK